MRIISIAPGVTIKVKKQAYADDISVHVEQVQIDRSVKTICYMKDNEAKELLEALKEIF